MDGNAHGKTTHTGRDSCNRGPDQTTRSCGQRRRRDDGIMRRTDVHLHWNTHDVQSCVISRCGSDSRGLGGAVPVESSSGSQYTTKVTSISTMYIHRASVRHVPVLDSERVRRVLELLRRDTPEARSRARMTVLIQISQQPERTRRHGPPM